MLAVDIQRGPGRGQGKRFTRIRRAHHRPLKFVHDRRFPRDDRQRQAIRYALREDRQIAIDGAVILVSPQGDAKPGHNLVKKQQRAVFSREFPETVQEIRAFVGGGIVHGYRDRRHVGASSAKSFS